MLSNLQETAGMVAQTTPEGSNFLVELLTWLKEQPWVPSWVPVPPDWLLILSAVGAGVGILVGLVSLIALCKES